MKGDFLELLKNQGAWREPVTGTVTSPPIETHGTTVLALRYKDGVLNLGDRRATAANAIMFDRAEKIMPLDDFTLVAIAGAYAKAIEVVRYLRHAFKYFARTQLQEISLEGKLQEVSRALAGNLEMAMQGIGLFVPLISAWDQKDGAAKIYFYDGMGARFESSEFGAAGSGSERIRGVFNYIERTKGPFADRSLKEVLQEGLYLLDIASDLDSATGGYNKILPTAMTVSSDGVREISEEQLRTAIEGVKN